MRFTRTLCALLGGLCLTGALAAPAGASFVPPPIVKEGMASAEWRVPSRYLYDAVINSITPNTCPRIRLGDMRMAAHDRGANPDA
jgi:hypothetical protein